MEEVTEKDRPGNCPYRQDNTSCMDKIRLFRGLPEKSREKLMAGVLHRSYEAGHVLIEEEEKVRSWLMTNPPRSAATTTRRSSSQWRRRALTATTAR